MAVRVGEQDFEEKVLKADKPVLIDFYSDSCIPCKRISGIIGDLQDEYEDKIDVYKVNVNFEEKLVNDYQILSVPTIAVFSAGKEAGRLTGMQQADAIKDLFINLI